MKSGLLTQGNCSLAFNKHAVYWQPIEEDLKAITHLGVKLNFMSKMCPVEKMIPAGGQLYVLLQSNTEWERQETGLNSLGRQNSTSIHSNHPGIPVFCKTQQVLWALKTEIMACCLQQDPIKGIFVLWLTNCQIYRNFKFGVQLTLEQHGGKEC